jgi:hypothetical protein
LGGTSLNPEIRSNTPNFQRFDTCPRGAEKPRAPGVICRRHPERNPLSALKTALATLWAPGRALKEAADGRLFFWPLLLATVIGVGYTALFLPRRTGRHRREAARAAAAEEADKMTPHERQEKVESVGKLTMISAYVSAALGPAFSALLAAFGLLLGFKVAGGKPAFAASFAVVAHARLTGAVPEILSVPALLQREKMDLRRPSSSCRRTWRPSPRGHAAAAPGAALLGGPLRAVGAGALLHRHGARGQGLAGALQRRQRGPLGLLRPRLPLSPPVAHLAGAELTPPWPACLSLPP